MSRIKRIPAELLEASAAIKQRLLERAKRQQPEHQCRQDPDPISSGSIVERLRRRFGLGDKPTCRQKFYESLEKLVGVKGEIVLSLISLAVSQSVGSRQPDRYFCACIKVLLLEKNIEIAEEKAVSQW